MVVFRDEDRDALDSVLIAQLRLHAEALGDLLNRALQSAAVSLKLGQIEMNALKKLSRRRIRMLIRVEDVRPMAVQDLRQRRHDAAPIRARDQQGRAFRGRRAHELIYSAPEC